MKNFIWLVLLLLIVGGGYYLYSEGKLDGIGSSQPNTETGANSDGNRIAEPTITWQFTDGGERDNIPYTKVFVTVNGNQHSVGDFQGSCSEIGESGGVDGKGLLPGELSAVQCWFAGGGDEIGVFAVEDGTIELMVGGLSEGIEGGAGFRGDFSIREDIRF